jgi:hypothetical protein
LKLDRHLVPDEIDLLLDEDAGSQSSALAEHVRECQGCAAELAAARRVIEEIEHLPHLAPSAFFAERLITRVSIFRPWYVAGLDLVRRLVPRSGAARALVATLAALAAVTLTAAAVWAVTQAEEFLVLVGFVSDQAGVLGNDVAATLFGSAAISAVQSGDRDVAVVSAAALLAAVAVGVAVVARVARAARVREE